MELFLICLCWLINNSSLSLNVSVGSTSFPLVSPTSHQHPELAYIQQPLSSTLKLACELSKPELSKHLCYNQPNLKFELTYSWGNRTLVSDKQNCLRSRHCHVSAQLACSHLLSSQALLMMCMISYQTCQTGAHTCIYYYKKKDTNAKHALPDRLCLG